MFSNSLQRFSEEFWVSRTEHADFKASVVSMNAGSYPDVVDPTLVGTYSSLANAGGGYVWDDVLEYRVWCHPERGASDPEVADDYYNSFATYAERLYFPEV